MVDEINSIGIKLECSSEGEQRNSHEGEQNNSLKGEQRNNHEGEQRNGSSSSNAIESGISEVHNLISIAMTASLNLDIVNITLVK